MTQRLYTVEIKVDFKDEDKFPLFEKILQQGAQMMFGQGAILNDGVKPEIALYGHDYFKGHADLALFDDDVENGKKAITEAGNLAPAVLTTGAVTETKPAPMQTPENTQAFDPALLAALK